VRRIVVVALAREVKVGKTPVLAPEGARALIDSIEVTTIAGLRDRALSGLMVSSFARIGAALAKKVEDMFTQNRRLWVRLRESGGKPHAMPCRHNLETYLAPTSRAPASPRIPRGRSSARSAATRAGPSRR
jgi:integrase